MPRFGIPNRESGGRIGQIAQVNWRRGLFRLWLLLSAAWIMGWTVYIVVIGIKDGFKSFGDLFAIPVLLIGPPVRSFCLGWWRDGPFVGSRQISGLNSTLTKGQQQSGRCNARSASRVNRS